jgi:hypothetical protein
MYNDISVALGKPYVVLYYLLTKKYRHVVSCESVLVYLCHSVLNCYSMLSSLCNSHFSVP